jgi:hypothetical protein
MSIMIFQACGAYFKLRLSSTNILCLHYRLQLIQVVIQYRSFILESHSKMMNSHQGDKSFIYIVQLVRSLV